MSAPGFRSAVTGVVASAIVVASMTVVSAQQPAKPSQAPKAAPQQHGDHGTPKGWTFRLPQGNPAKGREVFAKLECYSCHEVKGEKFPAPSDKGKVGPELAMMGPLHEAEYFAEAIVNPSAVIDKGKGYQAPDGTSKMPSFNDSLNVQELIDLVAFLKALKPAAGPPAGHKGQ
jgi:mono/diheme cytochrome c family protein